MLLLHVWGPAFHLPSIDAECLATIAYFVAAGIPRDNWTIVTPDNHTSLLSLDGIAKLPLLVDGTSEVSGFDNIVSHLRSISNGKWYLDAHLSRQQRADVIAFSSYIRTVQALLDLSFHDTSKNYTSITRPHLSRMLGFPTSWLLIPSIHSAALARCSHLTLAPPPSLPSPTLASRTLASSPLLSASMLSRAPSSSTEEDRLKIRIQLHQHELLSSFFSPISPFLENANNQHSYFFTCESPTSLDCLIFAYFALAYFPMLPVPWLRNGIDLKFIHVKDFVTRLRDTFMPSSVPLLCSPSPSFSVASLRSLYALVPAYFRNARAQAARKSFIVALLPRVAIGLLATTGLVSLNAFTEPETLSNVMAYVLRRLAWRGPTSLREFGEAGAALRVLLLSTVAA